MTPEAFLEICQQHYGTSNPGFVKAVSDIVTGRENTHSFEDFLAGLLQEHMALIEKTRVAEDIRYFREGLSTALQRKDAPRARKRKRKSVARKPQVLRTNVASVPQVLRGSNSHE